MSSQRSSNVVSTKAAQRSGAYARAQRAISAKGSAKSSGSTGSGKSQNNGRKKDMRIFTIRVQPRNQEKPLIYKAWFNYESEIKEIFDSGDDDTFVFNDKRGKTFRNVIRADGFRYKMTLRWVAETKGWVNLKEWHENRKQRSENGLGESDSRNSSMRSVGHAKALNKKVVVKKKKEEFKKTEEDFPSLTVVVREEEKEEVSVDKVNQNEVAVITEDL